jgi:hypothetical protein
LNLPEPVHPIPNKRSDIFSGNDPIKSHLRNLFFPKRNLAIIVDKAMGGERKKEEKGSALKR